MKRVWNTFTQIPKNIRHKNHNRVVGHVFVNWYIVRVRCKVRLKAKVWVRVKAKILHPAAGYICP